MANNSNNTLDILNLEPNKVSRDLKGKYLLIYGAPKCGKTHFCATQLPKPLLCAFEKGYAAIPNIKAVDIEKWTDFKKVLKQLELPEAKAMYDTIVIDTCDIMAQLCEKYVCQQKGVEDLTGMPYGILYRMYSDELSTALRKITMLGYGIALIAQQEVKVSKNSLGEEVEMVQPKLDKRALSTMNALVDFILYIGSEWDKEGNQHRYFYTRATPYLVAGSRFGEITPKIDFSYEALIDAIVEAMENSVRGKEGLLVDHVEKSSTIEKRPFSEVMSEAGELWAKFPKTPEWTEKKNNIVKEFFGQPIKLSTATETQQELVEGVIEELKELLKTVPS